MKLNCGGDGDDDVVVLYENEDVYAYCDVNYDVQCGYIDDVLLVLPLLLSLVPFVISIVLFLVLLFRLLPMFCFSFCCLICVVLLCLLFFIIGVFLVFERSFATINDTRPIYFWLCVYVCICACVRVCGLVG